MLYLRSVSNLNLNWTRWNQNRNRDSVVMSHETWEQHGHKGQKGDYVDKGIVIHSQWFIDWLKLD